MTDKSHDIYERRRENIPVDYDQRRRNDLNARVAVLEIKVSNTSDRLEESYAVTNRIVEKLDNHVLQSTQRDSQLQQSISDVTNAVTTLATNISQTNETLTDIAQLATNSNMQIAKWDTIVKTIAKIISIAAIVVGASWSVFTWVDSKRDHSEVVIPAK